METSVNEDLQKIYLNKHTLGLINSETGMQTMNQPSID